MLTRTRANLLIYIMSIYRFTSTPDKVNNKYYLGPAPLEDMARYIYIFLLIFICGSVGFTNDFGNPFRQIATAYGPCGNNRDYLFLLEKAMYDIGELFANTYTCN